MSEKHVNIKITASTTEFSNAMQKAQKQIDNLAEVIDKLGSSKFGNKLEEQFDGLVKAAKKAEEQVADMVGSLDDLGKIKFDKVGDKLEDISDSIKDINKGKFDKLEQQFKDIVDSGKDVSDKAKDILDLLDKVDKQDLDGLEKEFDQIKDALEKINKETRDSTDTMEKSFRDVADEVDRFIKELNNIEDTKLENLEESIKDLDKYVDEAAESITDFNKKTNELDNKEINDYIDSLKEVGVIGEDVKDSLKKIFGAFDGGNSKLDLDFSSNKDKGGLMSSLTEGLVSGTIAGKTLENVMEGVADSISDVTKQMKNLEDAIDTKSIDDLGEEYKEAESALEKLTEEYDDLIKKQTECEEAVEKSNKAQQEQLKLEHEIAEALSKKNKEIAECEAEMAGYKKVVDDWDSAIRQNVKDSTELVNVLERQEKAIDDAAHAESEAYNTMMEQRSAVEKLKKEYYDLADAVKQAYDDGEKDKAISIAEAWDKVRKELEEAKKLYKELEKVHEDAGKKWTDEALKLGSLEKQKDALLQQYDALQDQKKAADQAADAYNNLADNLDRLRKEAKELENALDDAMDEGTVKSLQEQLDRIDLHQIKKQGQEAAEELENIKERMAEINKVAQGHANDFDKQYKAYEKLSQEVKAYLEDEKNGILLREKAAKSFREVANSMEGVYAGSSKLNNADLIDKTLTEAAEHIKELNLVNTENLQADIKRLGEIVEDKTEKIKRFKELNKEFGSDASKAAAGLDKQAKDIRDWANSADFAIEAADTLTHAWGDLSAAGEDHMKIRNRSKYIEDYGKALEENVAHIKNYYHELQTLDEIYEECTGKQRAIIDDYKMWEKNKDKLLEYNRAINEYMRALRESGGEIDPKFLDEFKKFSPQKFIDNLERMGTASVVLQKQFNANKIEFLEWCKTEKEVRKEAVKNAKEALEQAKANQKAAESQEELAEATKKVAKAQEELANAKDKLKDFAKEASEMAKDINECAEGMRKFGMAADDIDASDIAEFDSSLASILKRLGTFSDDLPKSFADITEDIKALFLDMDSLDFGGVFDGLKDIGAGILSQLPTKLKLAAGFAWALEEALRACAKAGIEQLGKGIDTIKSALSGLVGIARDVGQEIGDAFSNITGMELDFSSLMEIPVNFESQMAKVGAIAGATGDDFKELEEEARRLGATTRYSATEVAEAMEYMGMAGWTNTQILAKSKDGLSALESVLKLATVAQMDLGQASDFVTDGLTALGMEAEQASYMVDILAAASTSSNTTVAQMQRAFTNCAPVAGTLGINIKDLSMALGLMADKGVKGAKAGTALKNLMANLSAPTEKQLAYIKKFNLEGAQQAIVNGNLLDGLKQMKAALKNLSPQQQNAIITTIAGKEALSGISALLNTTEEDLAEFEGALNSCDGAAKKMADGFDDTLEGALKGLASAMQETLLQLRDMTKEAEDSIKNIVNDITDFFHILNGFKESSSGLTGLAGAFEHLEETTQRWGDNIADGLEKAIGAIDNFINGPIFDDILQAGTNIINGIADGIKRAADNGSLDSAISGAIGKIADWFSDNLETIIDVGKEIIDAISDGISDNGPAIGKAIRAVMDLQTEIDKAVAKEKWKLIGDNLVSFICEGITSKVEVFISALSGFFSTGVTEAIGKLGDLFISTGSTRLFDPIMSLGMKIGEWLRDAILGAFNINLDEVFSSIGDKISSVLPWSKDKNKSSGSSKGSSKGSTGKAPSIDTSKSPIDIINSNLSSGKNKTDATAASIGEGISSNITDKLETMDAAGLRALNTEMKSLQTTVTALGQGMSASFTVIQDSARTAFMNFTNIVRNQMLNCTNIIRNQCVNWYNIINNQVTNARNALTSQFLSMAAVARTQMVNISNIVRNQAVAWKNIISNQVKNARDALTRQFMSMAAVARTQMNKVASSVKSSMSSISSATSRGISMNVNVNRSVSSGYSMPSANALYAANAGATFSLGNNMSAFANNAAYAAPSGNSGASSNNSSTGGGMVIEVPLYLDGKVIARATAKHMDNEIKTMTKRENRKRGAK